MRARVQNSNSNLGAKTVAVRLNQIGGSNPLCCHRDSSRVKRGIYEVGVDVIQSLARFLVQHCIFAT